jgi:hypothetical protein
MRLKLSININMFKLSDLVCFTTRSKTYSFIAFPRCFMSLVAKVNYSFDQTQNHGHTPPLKVHL